MKPYTKFNFAIAAILTGLLIGCTPTTVLTRTWTDPSVTPSTVKPFKRVLVCARIKDNTGNRIAEDKLVAQFKQYVAVPSYNYLRTSDTTQTVIESRLKKDEFDGVLVMRLVNVNESVTVHNSGVGVGYGYGYYGAMYGGGTSVYVDQNYLIETTIYSIETNKMLWSGTTSSLNPSSLEQTVDEVITAVRAQLAKQGLIKE